MRPSQPHQMVRYRFPGGTVVTRRRQYRDQCRLIPGWSAHVSNPITRKTAASLLREGRANQMKPDIQRLA